MKTVKNCIVFSRFPFSRYVHFCAHFFILCNAVPLTILCERGRRLLIIAAPIIAALPLGTFATF